MKPAFILGIVGILSIVASGGCRETDESASEPAGRAATKGETAGAADPQRRHSDTAHREDVFPPEDLGEPISESADLSALRAAVERDPADPEARRKLGIALRRAGRADEALGQLEQAVELAPEDVGTLLSLGVAYSGEGRLDDAEATYERILAVAPSYAKALNNLGNIALRRGDEQQAIAWYRRAVEADPDYLLARYKLAGVLKYYGHYEKAYRTYEEILAEASSGRAEQSLAIESLYNLGAINLSWQKYDLAEQQLAGVIRSFPQHRSAHYARAQALFQLGRSDEAQTELEIHMRVLAVTGEGF